MICVVDVFSPVNVFIATSTCHAVRDLVKARFCEFAPYKADAFFGAFQYWF